MLILLQTVHIKKQRRTREIKALQEFYLLLTEAFSLEFAGLVHKRQEVCFSLGALKALVGS